MLSSIIYLDKFSASYYYNLKGSLVKYHINILVIYFYYLTNELISSDTETVPLANEDSGNKNYIKNIISFKRNSIYFF